MVFEVVLLSLLQLHDELLARLTLAVDVENSLAVHQPQARQLGILKVQLPNLRRRRQQRIEEVP